ncbi:ABC transporter substrate-binding protein [uncultured Vibrio sp.]|uniref:ABC transporter substrate-binding protein n=1 Tax=uncultured Vibrio sp. TaxID=114054 RepID=UPI0025D0533C|nr:ABC transporter substrate-binding protein [uncultured Vibrio sp.]
MKRTTFKTKTLSMVMAAALAPAMAYASTDNTLDLEALIEAAQGEAPITVYAPSGKIVQTAENFTKKYDVKAVGSKVSSSAQVEMMVREYRANNVRGDVIVTGDASATVAQLIPMGVVETWVSPEVSADIADYGKDPLMVYGDPAVWTYNTEVHNECPVSNIWALTDEDWSRKVALPDPLNNGSFLDWFNQIEMHHDEAVEIAYERHYGKKLDTSKESATKAWVKALAKNSPLPTDSGSAAGDAVGAPGQTESFIGFMSTAKYRDVAKGKVHLGICDTMSPFVGWSTPSYGVMSTKTQSPNAAKLFLHFLMTEEGISNQTVDGKVSANLSVPVHPKEASGVQNVYSQVLQYNASTGLDDFDNRQDWADLWRINFRR